MFSRIIICLLFLFPAACPAQTLIRDAFGLNAVFGTVPLDKMDGFKAVRGYGSAASFCKEQEEYMFNPTWQNFKYDDYLTDAKSRGVKMMLCLTYNFSYFTGNINYTSNEDHPVPPGADKNDPASYVLYGKLAFQIAARYGSKAVDTSLLKVKSFPVGHWQYQEKRTGMDALYGIELWNEADKWGGTFTAPEYFAMLSACYDGHKGALGNDVGVMQADPDMKFFFTGTTDNTTTFTGDVRALWVQERGEPFPENIIINFHAYFHDKPINNNNRTTGIAPELGDALALYKLWADFSGNNRMAKTEYGYDTHNTSIQRAPLQARPDTGDYSREESQAALILRDFHLQSVFPQTIFSTFYQVRDENPGDGFVYSTTGVTYGSPDYEPKESYFILTGFISLSDGFYLNGTLLRKDPYVARYRNAQGDYLYAVWTHKKNKFTIPQVTTSDNTVFSFIATKDGIDTTMIQPQGGRFSIVAQHMPVYYISDAPLAFNVPICQPMSFAADSICAGDSVLIYGAWRKTPGIYYDTLIGNECDSIFATQLTVNWCGGLYLSGSITTESGKPVPGVTVNITGSDNLSVVTPADGSYAAPASTNGNYVITPVKNNDVTVANGVSTLDLALIQAHILNAQPFTSPFKIIAADVNGNGSVSTLDLVLIRGFILGNFTSFPGNRLWEFVRSDYVFPDPANPFPSEGQRAVENLTQPALNQNFIGIKLGDVNNSWNGSVP